MIFKKKLLIIPVLNSFAFSILQQDKPSSPSCDYSIIEKGGLYVQPNWITAKEIDALQRDIAYLRRSSPDQRSAFIPSGLSNRVEGDGNVFGKSDRLTCTLTPDLHGDRRIRNVMDSKLDDLIKEIVEQQQSRRGLSLEEQYYSISPVGSLLPRHMDERHEETKGGEKAWLSETRRSISWLIYLSDIDTVSGGELRAFSRHCAGPHCGAHDGNLQIGWLDCCLDEKRYEPVFLDCWVKTPRDANNSLRWQPLYSLYRLVNGRDEREYVSPPFGTESPGWPETIDLNTEKFRAALASQLFPHVQSKFMLAEDVHNDPIDIQPTAGTLVLFDSVVIPHEVLEVTRGERLALAGWFHEPQQSFPDWYGT